jgi:hypothetical protein
MIGVASERSMTNRPEAARDQLLRAPVTIDCSLHFQAAGAIREGEYDGQLLSVCVGCLRLPLQVVSSAREQRRLRSTTREKNDQSGSNLP